MRDVMKIMDGNVKRIIGEQEHEAIREDWKMTRQNYDRIDSNNPIDYNNAVVSAYSIGTTPIHIFLLQHLFCNHVDFSTRNSDSINIVSLCGGSGAELVALLTSLPFKDVHITIVDKEPLWKPTYAWFCNVI